MVSGFGENSMHRIQNLFKYVIGENFETNEDWNLQIYGVCYLPGKTDREQQTPDMSWGFNITNNWCPDRKEQPLILEGSVFLPVDDIYRSERHEI